jgi:hypothetical protein
VFSLKDFATVVSRFDTAGDLIMFLELRGDVAAREAMFVQDEIGNVERMIPQVEAVLRAHTSPSSEETLQKTVQAFERVATGKLLASVDWRYGLSIDDMIARVHDVDPELPWSDGNRHGSMEVARFLGWLTRERRMRLGKKIIDKCEIARDGKPHYFSHVQRKRGTACVYLVTSQSRPDRIKVLQFLVDYAHLKYGVPQCVGVATEPLGNGRSYDFLVTRNPSPALLEKLKTFDDPFSSESPL